MSDSEDKADQPRLIEVAFPLRQASLDSVHEKNVRHGHISTLHIWPARRPLAACRAALIATLLPDPGNDEGRKELLERIAGRVVRKVEKKQQGGRTVEVVREETEGGILHWGRENGPDLEWFRQEIRKAYGGRAPRVLDPFAGGGAIPLEAMRLGCEVTAIDINPVAWFILKCTLEYPQKLAGQVRPLPKFVLESPEFMEGFLKGTGVKSKKKLADGVQSYQRGLFPPPDVDLAWHVRAWGWWVLQRARADLERFYPTVGGKPTIAYLWARTVTCKNCRATIPLLKTRWICSKDEKRVLLYLESHPEQQIVRMVIQENVPVAGGNTAQKKEHDRRLGLGTMSRSGATCSCCGGIMTMADIRQEGRARRLGRTTTAVVVDGAGGKAYRRPTPDEERLSEIADAELSAAFSDIPYGIPDEPTPVGGGSGAGRAFSVQGYGLMHWRDLFTRRQILSMGIFVRHTRAVRDAMLQDGYPPTWIEAITAYLAAAVDRLADYNSTLCNQDPGGEFITHSFQRFALPVKWDFSEINPTAETSGNYLGALDWIGRFIENAGKALSSAVAPHLIKCSATAFPSHEVDLILTDPPYYDAIPYSDLMDFFYIWLRRTLYGLSEEYDAVFRDPCSPKWDHVHNDGELIDDASRFAGDRQESRSAYEDGMFRAFQSCHRSLTSDGRFVIVFAHKQPDAWETLVSAVIRAGFVVDASWPIQTERVTRTRAQASSALSASVWLVCMKRLESAGSGWDNRVLSDMREKLNQRLRDYWDAGIRGPDFVWAATGPALEVYSRYPAVKKANEPKALLDVSEFLRVVRRMVVDFVVGRMLASVMDAATGHTLDDVTTYYLLHRHDFGMDDAPIGACILYAVSCGLSDQDLASRFELIVRTGGRLAAEDDADVPREAAEEGEREWGGNLVRLRPWHQRCRGIATLAHCDKVGILIDNVHRLMHLWKGGELAKVDEYLNTRSFRRNAVFHQLLQTIIELAEDGSEERSLLECISNHIGARDTLPRRQPSLLDHMDGDNHPL